MKNSRIGRVIGRGLLLASIALPVLLLVVYLINPFGVRSYDPRQRIIGHGLYRMAGESMAPTVRKGQVLVVQAGYYERNVPRRGDVAIMLAPGTNGYQWPARIIGLAGETIALNKGQVEIDGRVLAEPYVASDARRSRYSRTMPALTVPEGHYFLMGDNRDNSQDSRVLGPIKRGDLTSRVRLIVP